VVQAFLHLHIHLHHFKGPAIDYVGLALAAFASWVGLPGPGETVLIATAVAASKHNLGIVSVLFVAWVAAVAGGIIGWLIGRRAGRALLTRRGPWQAMRQRAVERGDRVFERYTAIAILLTPPWIAGIHGVRTGVYLFWNALEAALWAGGIGMAAYLIGPSVVDEVNDLGLVTMLAVVGLVVFAVGGEILRRRRRRRAKPELQPRPGE
jgi:membrane protein DedA with SNARE-associated domain